MPPWHGGAALLRGARVNWQAWCRGFASLAAEEQYLTNLRYDAMSRPHYSFTHVECRELL